MSIRAEKMDFTVCACVGITKFRDVSALRLATIKKGAEGLNILNKVSGYISYVPFNKNCKNSLGSVSNWENNCH